MNIIKANSHNLVKTIDDAAKIIRAGGVVVYPTDTCYGLGGDFSNNNVVEKINRIKNRPNDKKLSVIVKDVEMAKQYCDINHEQEKILNKYLPGPYTFVLKAKVGDTTLGVRIPKYSLTQALADKLQIPYFTTSANLSGQAPCYNIDCLKMQLKNNLDKIDLIIDAGDLPQNRPSRVMDLIENQPRILRT